MPWPRQRSSSTLTFIRHTVDEVEFQVQFGESTQDVGRDILVATLARRAVVRLADPDVGGAVEQPLEPDPGLGAGQRCAGAAVDPTAESQMLARVLALGIEVSGSSKRRGSRLAAPLTTITVQPAPIASSPMVTGTREAGSRP